MVALPAPQRANEQWALDFLEDALASGRKIRLLSVIDVFTREALALEVDTSLPGRPSCTFSIGCAPSGSDPRGSCWITAPN